MTAQPTIVLVHGLWMTPLSWEDWAAHFRARGHEVLAPGWPGVGDRSVEDLRDDPSAIARLGVAQIVDYYDRIIRGLPSPPVIMGHSFGGAVTQLLLDRGLGRSGVALDSAPLRGVLPLPFSSLKSSFPVLRNPANLRRAVMLSPQEFHYAFTNTLPGDEAAEVYRRLPIPGPGQPLFEAATANLNPKSPLKIHYENPDRPPLLLITGEQDHIAPPAIARFNAKLQRKAPSVTAYRQFPGKTHFIVGQDGWEEIADFALDWALSPVAIG